jgi:hypothetical protein
MGFCVTLLDSCISLLKAVDVGPDVDKQKIQYCLDSLRSQLADADVDATINLRDKVEALHVFLIYDSVEDEDPPKNRMRCRKMLAAVVTLLTSVIVFTKQRFENLVGEEAQREALELNFRQDSLLQYLLSSELPIGSSSSNIYDWGELSVGSVFMSRAQWGSEEDDSDSEDDEDGCKAQFTDVLLALCNTSMGSGNLVCTNRTQTLVDHCQRHHIYTPGPTRRHGYRGMQNKANNCYALSVLQALNCLPAFRRYLLRDGNNIESGASTVLMEIKKVFAMLNYSVRPIVDPSVILNTFYATLTSTQVPHPLHTVFSEIPDGEGLLEAGQQNDAAAFVTQLFTILHRESTAMKAQSTDDGSTVVDVTALVTGQFRTVLEGTCSFDTTQPVLHMDKMENFTVLTLNTRSLQPSQPVNTTTTTLERALRERLFKHPVNYGWSDKNIENPSSYNTTMHNIPVSWPPCLIIQPKRFGFDKDTLLKYKLSNSENEFTFPHEFDMADYGGNKYSLRSIVIHSGSATDGHYWSFCKVGTDESDIWVLIDDDVVTQCSHKRAFAEAASSFTCPDNAVSHQNRDSCDTSDISDTEDEEDWTVDDCTSAFLLIYTVAKVDGNVGTSSPKWEEWAHSQDLQSCIETMLE